MGNNDNVGLRSVNQHDDFDFIIYAVSNGERIQWPDVDFNGYVYTGKQQGVDIDRQPGAKFRCENGIFINCALTDDGGLHVSCNNHGLQPGIVKTEVWGLFPSAQFPDGNRRIIFSTDVPLRIVEGDGSSDVTALEVELTAPFIVATAYDMARQAGYEGTRQEYVAAVAELPDVVDEAKATLSTSTQAAQLAQQAAEAATQANEAAEKVLEAADNAIASAAIAAENASSAATYANDQALGAIEAAANANEAAESATQAVAGIPTDIARTNYQNMWTEYQSFDSGFSSDYALLKGGVEVNDSFMFDGGCAAFFGLIQLKGDLQIEGNIIQRGQAYETHAQQVYTTQDIVYLREGAVSGIPAGSYVGLVARRYNGTDDGYLVYDQEGARVGKQGDTEPLLTRDERQNMVANAPLVWDSQRNRAVTGAWPEMPQLPAFTYKEMEVTYDDDSVETFYMPTLANNPNA